MYFLQRQNKSVNGPSKHVPWLWLKLSMKIFMLSMDVIVMLSGNVIVIMWLLNMSRRFVTLCTYD